MLRIHIIPYISLHRRPNPTWCMKIICQTFKKLVAVFVKAGPIVGAMILGGSYPVLADGSYRLVLKKTSSPM